MFLTKDIPSYSLLYIIITILYISLVNTIKGKWKERVFWLAFRKKFCQGYDKVNFSWRHLSFFFFPLRIFLCEDYWVVAEEKAKHTHKNGHAVFRVRVMCQLDEREANWWPLALLTEGTNPTFPISQVLPFCFARSWSKRWKWTHVCTDDHLNKNKPICNQKEREWVLERLRRTEREVRNVGKR